MNQTGDLPKIEYDSAPEVPSARNDGSARRFFVAASVVLFAIAFGIFHGIHSRAEAEAKLQGLVQASAIPVVEVVHPRR
jgi:hypothetical protein